MFTRIWLKAAVVALGAVMLSPVVTAAEASTSDRECRIGTEHAACLWSEPNYTGQLTTFRKGIRRTTVDQFQRVRSYKLHRALVAGTGDTGGAFLAWSNGDLVEKPASDPWGSRSDGWVAGVNLSWGRAGQALQNLRQQFQCEVINTKESCGTETETPHGGTLVARLPAPGATGAKQLSGKTATPERAAQADQCLLGLEHSVCLWSKPNYEGDLIALPLGYDRMVLGHLGFTPRSAKSMDIINLFGHSSPTHDEIIMGAGPFVAPSLNVVDSFKLDLIEYRDVH
ncbi:hypothetical protein [Crossiella sp. CA198]|uniref:hypothetical protein n=1 Tax=Crossiella sp. CA198 TaxID=3455607 RepID=UPI003F8CFD16